MKKVPVHIWAKQYESSTPIAGARITDITTGESWRTGRDGYARAEVEPGRVLTLVFSKVGMPSVQGASVTVPEEGLTGENKEMTLQVPGKLLYHVLMAAFGGPRP